MARITAGHKLKLFEILDLFKAAGIAALLVFALQTLHNESNLAKFTNDQVIATKAVVDQIKLETQELKVDSHSDHDTLLKSINCMAELFGEHPNQYIPKSEFDACLAGTRIAPVDNTATSTSPSAPMNTTTNTSQTTLQNKQPGQTSNNKNQQGQSGSLSRGWHRLINLIRRNI